MIQERLEWEWLAHQREFFDFEPQDRIETSALLGGWGSGKTTGLARKCFKIACANPWTSGYGRSNPTGLVVAPTYRILRHATLPAFERAIPRSAVKKSRGSPHNDMLLSNGFRFLFYSGEGALEGVTACLVGVDEIHHPVFSSNAARYMNMVARVRDPLSPRMGIIVAGLPESGWVRDMFDRAGPNRFTRLAGMADNRMLPREAQTTYLEACPGGYEEMLIRGRWMAPQFAVYPQFSGDLHVVKKEPNPREPVHLGMDVGNFGCILVAQEIDVQVRNIIGQPVTATGMLIVDEMLTSDESVEQQCYRLKTERPWIVRPGVSRICVDPTIRRDEIGAIKKHFPGCKIVKLDRADDLYPIESGIRVVQRALRDALGNVRLLFSKRLEATQLGVLDAIQRYRRNERTQIPIKDNLRDHPIDALRYLVCELLPVDRPHLRVL
jgi:hypothetical protein